MKPQLKTIITLTLALLSCLAASANSTDYAVFTEGPDRTFIAGNGIVATIITDRTHELTGVKWATENLAKDFERVTGKRAASTTGQKVRLPNQTCRLLTALQ